MKKRALFYGLFLLILAIFLSGCCEGGCCGNDANQDGKGKAENIPRNPVPPPPPPQATCQDGEQLPCPQQTGVCKDSKRTCLCTGTPENPACTFTPCDTTTYGRHHQIKETKCDGLDNDCDGTVDELC